MPHLIVARQNESLDWIHALPGRCSLTIYNAGDAVDAAAFDHEIEVHRVPAGTPAMASYLRHLHHGPRAWRGDLVVFTRGDPLAHSPAFLDLLANSDRFTDLQVLSAHSDNDHCPPLAVRAADRRDWIGEAPVRAERYSLNSLAPLAYQHDAALRSGKVYRRKHRLAEGVPALAHFFDLAGLTALAEEARQADLGVYAHAGMVAVRAAHLTRQVVALQPHLERLTVLTSADTNYPEVLERAWLHLLGLPFLRLEAMAPPQPAAQQLAAPAMARVVASIDAVLAASLPIPVLKPETAIALQPPRIPPAVPAPALTDVVQLHDRARAAFLRGETSLAWDWLQQALNQSPRDITLLAEATQMAYAQQDTERALHCARRALAVDPDHVECQFTLAMCLAASGQAEEALALFERLHQHPLAEQWQAQHPEWPSLSDAPLKALQATSLRRSRQAA